MSESIAVRLSDGTELGLRIFWPSAETSGQVAWFYLDPEGFTAAGVKNWGRALSAAGYAVVIPTPGAEQPQEAGKSLLLTYRETLRRFADRLDPRKAGLLARNAATERLAEGYYSYYAIEPPWVGVLLAPSGIQALHLNNFTCPFWIAQGTRDPRTGDQAFAIAEAVKHHQVRYGDLTRARLFDGIGAELGRDGPEEDLWGPLIHWLKRVKRSPSRPQEPAAPSAA